MANAVADTLRQEYEADFSNSAISPLVASASGMFGTNAEYAFRLQAALRERHLKDPYVDDIASAL